MEGSVKYLFAFLAMALLISACSSSDDGPLVRQEPLPNDVRPRLTATFTEAPPDSAELGTPERTYTNVASLLAAAEGEPGPASFYDQAWLLIAHGYRDYLTQVFPAPDLILEFYAPREGRGELVVFDSCQVVEGEFTLAGQTLTSSSQFVNRAGCVSERYEAEYSLIYDNRSQFFWTTLGGLTSYELVNDLLVLTSAEAGVLVLQWLDD